MPRNASGIYTLPGGNPVTPGDVIEADWANTTLEDVADALTNSLSRTGAGGMLAPFRIADGSISGPGLSYLNETNTGLYRSGSGSTWMAVLGVNVAQFSTVGLTIPFGKALTAQGNASVSGTLAVTGATTFGSTLAVTGAITATGGVTGNIAGNVTATTGTSTFNDVVVTGSLDMTAGSSATITGLSTPTNASDAANKGYVDAQDALRLALTGGTMSGAIAMGNSKISGLATPTLDADAATKAYVDSVAQGLDVKGSCRVGTTANITLSGTQTIDGVAVIAGDRVLVKDQSTAANNGIYVVAAGSWSRATDADTWAELVGAFTFVEEGTVNDNSGWVCTSPAGGTLGVTAVTWEQFSGAGQITAGAGMFKSGNTLNVGTASSSRIVVNTDDIDLATTGVAASTYKSVTVDTYGRVTGGTNPTTLAGYGITDAYTQTQVNTALALKLNLTGGTMSGVIAMGANKITGLADPTNPQDAATKTYIDTIFGSTTTAAASAAAAASSATAAATSATNASNSATAAAGSATSAAASFTSFDNQYLGSKASDPSTNNTGGALVAGNLYWNSTVNEMRVYSGSAWTAAYLPASGYMDLTSNQTAAGNKTFSNDLIVNGLKVGRGAGAVSTNTAVGASALAANTTGATNTAVGNFSLLNSTTANGITAVGYASARDNTTGGNLSAVGYFALESNTTGSNNTAFGTEALQANTTASNNTAVGYQAGYSKTTSSDNTAIGYQSQYAGATGIGNTSIGLYSLYNNTGNYNTALGNTALGNAAVTGSNNVAVGMQALQANTTASNNTAVGYQAGYTNTTGISNVFIGYKAGYPATGGVHTVVGSNAGVSMTTATNNTLIGETAGYNLTTGSSNTFVGNGAGLGGAGASVTTGSKNTIIGAYSGNQGGLDIRTASNYIVLSDGDGNPRGVCDSNGKWNFNSVSGNSYNYTSTSGGTAITDTGIYYGTSVMGYGTVPAGAAIYDLYMTGNPNAGGSSSYKNTIAGYIVVTTGYDFGIANVVNLVTFVQTANVTGQNNSAFTMSVVFWNGSTESSSVVAGTTNAQIRIKVSGYNSSYTGDAQLINLTKRL